MNTLIKAANVPEVEPIWATLFAKALEGKDVKDMLLNVGSGGGAAAAAPGAGAGGAAAGGAAEEAAPAEEEKEAGMFDPEPFRFRSSADHYRRNREGRIRRGYGFRSFRLSVPALCTALLTSFTTLSEKRHHSHGQKSCSQMHTFPALRF